MISSIDLTEVKNMYASKLEILLIEDNLWEANLIREMLSEDPRVEFSVQQVQHLAEGLARLQEQHFDVVLVDLDLPDSQGLESALIVRRQSRGTPVIALTVLDDEETALKCLQNGIQDYLTKGEINGSILVRSIRYALQRKRDAESLWNTENRYRALFNAIDEGFCIVEVIFDDHEKPVDYRFLETNLSFEKQTGLKDAQGKRMLELAPKHEEHWFEIYGRIALTGEPARFQNKAAQLQRWYDVYAFRFGAPENRRVAIIFQDITERHRAEEEVKRLNLSLAERADELETVNKELEAFNRTVAHDLRQPLNALSTYCQAIQVMCGEQLQEECTDYVQNAYKVILRMSGIIESLLNFSRIGHVELRRELFDIGLAAHEVARELKLTDPGRKVDFRIAEGMLAKADANLLRLALDNLLGNAWKYTCKREEALIEIGVTDIDGMPTYFVRDNGSGFDSACADKLFAPFQRLPGALEHKGFGVGLATVDSIIRRHGGKVWAKGEPDKGATFYFTLPEGEGIHHENPAN